MLVKIAPDLTDPAIAEVLEVCADRGAAGVIATNTTLARDGLAPPDAAPGRARRAGCPGAPLTARAREVVRVRAPGDRRARCPSSGSAGSLDPDDAARLFDAGASLVQLYTGFIYRGPALVSHIARAARR